MVYFIIITYNSIHFIGKCIDSISTYEPNSKIIVVDNNSEDGTIDLIRNYRNVLLIENRQNLGFGKANNIGIELAIKNGADYVYLLNHDAYLVEPILVELIEFLNVNENVGIISPFHLAESEIDLEPQFYKFMFEQGVLNLVYKDLVGNGVKSFYEVHFIPAASWLISVNTIKTVGLFNHNFFHYGEDNNYAQRMAFWKRKIFVTNKTHIVHIGNKFKRNYTMNYEGFHSLVIKARFLSEFLDVNQEIPTCKVLNNVMKDCKKGVFLIFRFRFKLLFNLCKILLWKFQIISRLKRERLQQIQQIILN
jgi:N-acetylglucosaminyl-diphospho-decaprenol L-rhamnosyltransferase